MSTAASALYTGRIFPGLRPFDAEDALLFFGREEQVDELLRRLQDTRFLAVVGLSGSGKSSLVRADLVEEMLDRTGDDPDQLPVLQHLLMRMCRRRPLTRRPR